MACSQPPGGSDGETGVEAGSPTAQLTALFESNDERTLVLDPLGAIGRGDLRFAEQFGDYLSRDYYDALATIASDALIELDTIDRSSLSEPDQIAYDAFRHDNDMVVQGAESGVTDVLRQLPIDQLFGQHVTFPDMSTGDSLAPFETVADYENGLSRLRGFASYLDRAQEPMREGIDSGHVQPAFVTELVIGQLDSAFKVGADKSPLMGPVQKFPDDMPEKDRGRFKTLYRDATLTLVLPAYQRLRDFLSEEYLPHSRNESPGLCTLEDGDEVYRYLIALHTASSLTPEEIHVLGLAEVDRIRGEMESILGQVGFEGTLQQFFDYQRKDPKFQFASEEAMLEAYERVKQTVEPRLSELFTALPAAQLEIRPVPLTRQESAGGAYYFPGTPDGSRSGVFYVNTYDLPSRINTTTETLFLHEGVPGHHLQGSLAQENLTLPPFLRFGWNTAYGEGWGLYAESLGPELGMFTDPYQRFGHLDLEMFRALRLVVDTGLHSKCWNREQAVNYMLENSSLGRTALVQDVDRYVVWPGQALAYKLGQLKLQELRTLAEKALGAKFDLRQFHDQVLNTGSIPLPVLEQKIRSWINRQ